MTALAKLKHFMAPYYQAITDEELLQDYLTEYTYPECAASKLWYELQGKVSFKAFGALKINTGAEKFDYASPNTTQLACEKQAKYYEGLCNALNGQGSCVIRVAKATVGGISAEYGSD